MIYRVPEVDRDAPAIVVEVGNTTTAIATWSGNQIKTPLSVPTTNESAFSEAFSAHITAAPKGRVGAVVIGSVVPRVLERIRAAARKALNQEALVVGDTVALPIELGAVDRDTIGVDRVCAAAAAYETLQAGCIIVDFGTAVTVDLVDDEGTLLGGAILPGLHMQFRALHEFTAVLPAVERGVPEQLYGRNTVEAIQTGVCRGLAGATRGLVEGYAGSLGRWPQVVATGGDLEFMAPFCDFLDTQVKHLALRGIGIAYTKHLEAMGA